MSYEGYVQVFCVNGHIYEEDRHDPDGSTGKPNKVCVYCAGDIYHVNMVDDTNCDEGGKIDVKSLEEKPEIRRVTEEVRESRHFTFTEYAPEVYKVLTKEELRKLRTWK